MLASGRVTVNLYLAAVIEEIECWDEIVDA